MDYVEFCGPGLSSGASSSSTRSRKAERGLRARPRPREGRAVGYRRGRNADASPYRFRLEVEPEVWFLEDEGYELAVFHHPVVTTEALTRRSRAGRALGRALADPAHGHASSRLAARQRAGGADAACVAVVVGAGVFGGSLALRLVSSGWEVTLVEQYPPGHAAGLRRRVAADPFLARRNDWYTRSAWRALEL